MTFNKFRATLLGGQPVFRLLILGFLLTSLLPVGILGFQVYRSAWDDAWREIREKHQLLAENLAAPIRIYVDDHRQLLAQLTDEIASIESTSGATEYIQQRIDTSVAHLEGFRALVYLDLDANIRGLAHRQPEKLLANPNFDNENCFVNTRASGSWSLSGIKSSPLTGEPVIILSQPVLTPEHKMVGVLLAELRVDVIESLRKNIRFGRQGHSAIVDKFGRVIAHPNPGWMAEMRDLSHLSIVKSMLAGKTGVTEFYSPFIKENMVAGYTAVPTIGWGVMVPQPKSEVSEQVNALFHSHIIWMLVGIVLALALAIPLARWITNPINRLARNAQSLQAGDLDGKFSTSEFSGPREVQQLDSALHDLVNHLQRSRQEVHELNASLQYRVNEATSQLIDANRKLEHLAQIDYLTTLLNRRYFENELNSRLGRRTSDQDPICIILIDIDHFKAINDQYGHAVGDKVLVEVARVLRETMRPGDIVARYGGDEFVAQLNCESRAIGTTRANDVRKAINNFEFEVQDDTIKLSVSIGVAHCRNPKTITMKKLLNDVDKAMYKAKQAGRNRVVELEL